MQIAASARILSRVILDETAIVGDFAIIGEWPDEADADKPQTVLGPGTLLRSHTVIYAGVTAGDHFQTGHGALIREYTRLGSDVSIGSHSVLEHHVEVGNRVRVHTGVFIPEYTRLEDDCWIGPKVTMTNAPHPRCVNIPKCLAGVTIGRGAKIGANATLLPGVKIGEMALIGAGAVVTKDIPPGKVAVGVPARVIASIQDLKCPLDGVTPPYSFDEIKG